jgi:hypothetical protein
VTIRLFQKDLGETQIRNMSVVTTSIKQYSGSEEKEVPKKHAGQNAMPLYRDDRACVTCSWWLFMSLGHIWNGTTHFVEISP